MTSAPGSPARAVGALVGSAVGDAPGAPFESGPERVLSARSPQPGAGDEMCGAAAVAGGPAGAVHGVHVVPARWTDVLHVPLPGSGERVLRSADLREPAERLAGAREGPRVTGP